MADDERGDERQGEELPGEAAEWAGEGEGEQAQDKQAVDQVYSDEWLGEGFSRPPTPPPSAKATVISLEKAVEAEGEEEAPEVEEEEAEEEEEEEEVEEEKVSKVSSIEERIPSVLLRPKLRTESEMQFEADHAEAIAEDMRKIVHKELQEEPEKEAEEERPAIPKKKVVMAQVDVTGLYEPPKKYVSEISFEFDDEEEAARGAGQPETDEEVTQFVMSALQSGVKHDPTSIFALSDQPAIAGVRQFVARTVQSVRAGVEMDIAAAVNEELAELKQNHRTILILRFREKLGKHMKAAEVAEDQEVRGAGKRVKKKRGDVAGKAVATQEELLLVTEQHRTVVEGKVAEDLAEKMEMLEAEKMHLRLLGKEAETKKEGLVDWSEMLTPEELEKYTKADPCIRIEMEKYIRENKAAYEAEQRRLYDKRMKEMRYASKDPVVRLSNLNLTVTMKFVLNNGEIFTIAHRYFLPFRQIKEDLAGIFKVPSDVLIIYRCDVEVKDEQCCHDLTPEIEPFDCVEFRLLTADNDRWQLRSWHLDMPIPDIMTFTVETGKDYKGASEYREVVVEIEDRRIKKPFVGGLKDVRTGLEYHHAFTQCTQRFPALSVDRLATRDTQTLFWRKKLVDTTCPKATQMSRSDHFINTEHDKIITPKPYVDYATACRLRDLEGKVRIIQRYLRAMILRRFIKRMSEEYRKRKAWEDEQERLRVEERERRIKKDVVEMTYPKTKEDFDMLYAMVERWRKAQVERISKLKTEAPRRAELCTVLEKEVKLLEAIEVHRITILKQQRKERDLKFMEKVAKPVEWTGYRGMTIKMDTLKTQRARELKELYQGLQRHDMQHHERIECLMALKYALRVNNTRLTIELQDLINRECDLLIRGVDAKQLEFLRRRIEHLFSLYFKEPEFNPEMAKYSPDYNRVPFKGTVVFCRLCQTMKKCKEFSMTARDTDVNVCKSCRSIYNIAVPRIDLNPFRYILRCVRRDEQKRNCYSSSAFILQDEDMRFLVMNVWRGRSCVSETDNLMDLRLPRWDAAKDWTPWNCVLLTEVEARSHLRSPPSANYEEHLLGEIVSKHELAKRHFQQLFATDARMRDVGHWANVVDVKRYQSPPICADFLDLTHEEKEKMKEKGRLYEVNQTSRKEEGYVKYI